MNVAQPPYKENSQVISSSINSSGSSFWMWGCTFLTKCFISFYFLFSLSTIISAQTPSNSINKVQFFQNGITLTAPPNPFRDNPMHELESVCTEWVALIPYGFIRKGSYEVLYNVENYQWWGETLEGIEKSLQLAKERNLKVMLKPQLWMMHQWIGDFEIKNDQALAQFAQSYENYIISFARLAEKYDVEMFCIATEFKQPLNDYPDLLQTLLKKLRTSYSGKILYAANWDNYDQIPFWDELDFIGINAYFPLIEDRDPGILQLKTKWSKILSEIEDYSCSLNKKVWFTEYGYLSVDGAAGKTWVLEKNLRNLEINERAQSIALEALYQSVASCDFLEGGFLWKWFPEGMGHEGYPEKDYTPQNKLSETTIRDYFCP